MTDDLPITKSERIIGRGQADKKPGLLETKEQAINYLEECLATAAEKRSNCDVIVPGDTTLAAKLQRKAFQTYLMTVGRCLGAVETLYKTGWIDERAFQEFHQKTLNTLASSIVGKV